MKTVKTAVSGIFWALIVTVSILMGAGRLAGFEALIVQSGSMEPGIPTGSLAVVDTGCDYGSIETGDIIIFQAGEERVMHRAYAVTEKGIETKGDANEVVKFPSKREKTLKYALQNVKNHPLGLLFSRKILNLSQNKSKIFNAS